MADDEKSDSIPMDATEVRFSTRSLLILMAVSAVAASALGAFIRQFPVDVRPRLTLFWGVLVAILSTLVVFHAWRRRMAERKAGHVFLYVVRHSYYFPRQPVWAMYLAGGLSLLIAPAMWVMCSLIVASEPSQWWKMINEGTIYAIIVSGAGITFFWWRRIRVCENGLVVRNRFLPWTRCNRWYWDTSTQNVLVTVFSGYGTLAVRVPENSHATLEAIVSERIAGKFYD